MINSCKNFYIQLILYLNYFLKIIIKLLYTDQFFLSRYDIVNHYIYHRNLIKSVGLRRVSRRGSSDHGRRGTSWLMIRVRCNETWFYIEYQEMKNWWIFNNNIYLHYAYLNFSENITLLHLFFFLNEIFCNELQEKMNHV